MAFFQPQSVKAKESNRSGIGYSVVSILEDEPIDQSVFVLRLTTLVCIVS